MCIFKRKPQTNYAAEERFQRVVDLIKDLNKTEFTKLSEGVDLAWQGYNKIRSVKTETEKADLKDSEEIGYIVDLDKKK